MFARSLRVRFLTRIHMVFKVLLHICTLSIAYVLVFLRHQRRFKRIVWLTVFAAIFFSIIAGLVYSFQQSSQLQYSLNCEIEKLAL